MWGHNASYLISSIESNLLSITETEIRLGYLDNLDSSFPES